MSVDTAPAVRVGEIGRAKASVQALRVLAAMRREGRTVATDAERVTLAGWSGWGPLTPMFAPKSSTWESIAEEVRALLPADDVEVGFAGTYNAFYTPPEVATAMWAVLGDLGFSGGRVFEPGIGGGVFAGTAPAGVHITGVERDPTAAAIAAALYPDATVICGKLQATKVTEGFAAAIGNVPFGDVAVFDPGMPKELCESLHNYFIARAVQALAPGGVAVLLTSRYTMDSGSAKARRALAEMAEFVGAIRLPNGGLGGGTDIVSDIVILRRRIDDVAEPDGDEVDGEDAGPDGPAWFAVNGALLGWNVPLNEWWSARPDAVLGDMARNTTTQYGLTLSVTAPAGAPPVAERIATVGAALAKDAAGRGVVWAAGDDDGGPPLDDDSPGGAWYEGAFRWIDGALHKRRRGQIVQINKPSGELMDLLRLRDLAVKLVALEADHALPDRQIEPVRADTRAAYEAYVAKFGYLNRSTVVEGPADEETGLPTYRRVTPTMGGFRSDPDAALVFALEAYSDTTKKGKPAPILDRRQNRPTVRPMATKDPAQALGWCLDRNSGVVDLAYIAALLDVDPDEVVELLGDAVYEDPQTRRWVTADEYASGDVRAKYAVAQAAASVHPQRFGRNVERLAAALPPWRGPGEITANIGTPWIGPDDVADFAEDLLGYRPRIGRIKGTGQWEVVIENDLRYTVKSQHQWGTQDVDGYTLIQLALNGKIPVVRREETVPADDGGTKTVSRKDPEASLLASTRQQAIRERFEAWVWEDADRSDRLVHLFNTRYNNLAPRRFDGTHVTVEGLVPEFKPYEHQREFVARAVGTPAVLCGHEVGAGKTASIAMTAMKLRESKLANKPMVVVPNHLLEQVDREARQLFPGAKILTASSETIAADRRSFTARVATGEWDMVIITHSAFDVMPVQPKTEIRYLLEQRAALRESIYAACPDRQLKGRMAKAAAKRLDSLTTRIEKLRHRVRGYDKGVTFEQLGVDYLLIDEAHRYKNLAVPCQTEGFSIAPSKRATDLDVKLSWLSGRGSGRYLALFTGTPVSNTMLELYIVLHYTMHDYLASIDLASADPWARCFVQFDTTVEVSVDGGQFGLRTQPRRFVNARQLRMLLSQVADIRTAEQLGLKRPAADHRTVVVRPTRAQRRYSKRLVQRVEKIKGKRSFHKGEDNMLKICSDGRWMATDPALVGIHDDAQSKLHIAARLIAAEARENPDELQIAFCDIGTPNADKGTQTYGRLRRLLIDEGMDGRRIRFVHDAKTDAAKAALFDDCRAGRVSVIMGSTGTLGTGTNIQDRVVAMHHIDAPWRPSDVQQREGRGIRPGNRNRVVRIYRYVTERTFDCYLWQMLTRKIGFITQVVSGHIGDEIEDIGADEVDSYAAVKAAATGQPLLLEQAAVEADVKKLRGLQGSHAGTLKRLRREIPEHRKAAERYDAEAKVWDAIKAKAGRFVDEDAERLHELAKKPDWRRQKAVFAGLTVEFHQWNAGTHGKPQWEPEMRVDGGAGWTTRHAFGHWEPPRILTELQRVIDTAQGEGDRLRARAQERRQQITDATEMLARPFAQADELTAALARLDQIKAALEEAAHLNRDAGKDENGDDLDDLDLDDADEDGGAAFEITERGIVGTVHNAVGASEVDVDELDALFGGFKSKLEIDVDNAFAQLARLLG